MLNIPSTINSIKTLADGGLSINLHTNELKPESLAEIFTLKEQQVWATLTPTTINKEDLDIPDVKPEFKGDKTNSQRLRSVIFVIWESTDKKKTFNEYYNEKTELIINWLKEKYLN